MYKHFYERIMFLGVLLIILLIIYSLVLPGIVFANTMWEVDQKYLRYIYFDKNLDKAKYSCLDSFTVGKSPHNLHFLSDSSMGSSKEPQLSH